MKSSQLPYTQNYEGQTLDPKLSPPTSYLDIFGGSSKSTNPLFNYPQPKINSPKLIPSTAFVPSLEPVFSSPSRGPASLKDSIVSDLRAQMKSIADHSNGLSYTKANESSILESNFHSTKKGQDSQYTGSSNSPLRSENYLKNENLNSKLPQYSESNSRNSSNSTAPFSSDANREFPVLRSPGFSMSYPGVGTAFDPTLKTSNSLVPPPVSKDFLNFQNSVNTFSASEDKKAIHPAASSELDGNISSEYSAGRGQFSSLEESGSTSVYDITQDSDSDVRLKKKARFEDGEENDLSSSSVDNYTESSSNLNKTSKTSELVSSSEERSSSSIWNNSADLYSSTTTYSIIQSSSSMDISGEENTDKKDKASFSGGLIPPKQGLNNFTQSINATENIINNEDLDKSNIQLESSNNTQNENIDQTKLNEEITISSSFLSSSSISDKSSAIISSDFSSFNSLSNTPQTSFETQQKTNKQLNDLEETFNTSNQPPENFQIPALNIHLSSKEYSTISINGQADPSNLHYTSPIKTISNKQDKGIVYVFGSGEINQIPAYNSRMELKKPKELQSLSNENIIKISCGSLHNVLLTDDGRVLTFGCNDDGALGRHSKEEFPEEMPSIINLSIKIIDISCGDSHTAFLTFDGYVYITGTYRDKTNKIGFPDFMTGHGCVESSFYPQLVQFPNSNIKIKQIGCGEDHTVCLTTEGNIWSWGSNEFGQIMLPLENSNKINLLFPQEITSKFFPEIINGVKSIYCGHATTFVHTNNDLVYGCGRNSNGEVGCNSDEPIITKLTEITNLSKKNLKYISGGQFFCLCLLEDGELFGWGNSDFLGLGEKQPQIVKKPTKIDFFEKNNIPIKSIECAADHAFLISNDGHLYGWGAGQNYQLGNQMDNYLESSPIIINSSLFKNQYVNMASGGSQHSVVLVLKDKLVKELPVSVGEDVLPPYKRKFDELKKTEEVKSVCTVQKVHTVPENIVGVENAIEVDDDVAVEELRSGLNMEILTTEGDEEGSNSSVQFLSQTTEATKGLQTPQISSQQEQSAKLLETNVGGQIYTEKVISSSVVQDKGEKIKEISVCTEETEGTTVEINVLERETEEDLQSEKTGEKQGLDEILKDKKIDKIEAENDDLKIGQDSKIDDIIKENVETLEIGKMDESVEDDKKDEEESKSLKKKLKTDETVEDRDIIKKGEAAVKTTKEDTKSLSNKTLKESTKVLKKSSKGSLTKQKSQRQPIKTVNKQRLSQKVSQPKITSKASNIVEKATTSASKTAGKDVTTAPKTTGKNVTTSAKAGQKEAATSSKQAGKNVTTSAKTVKKDVTTSTKTAQKDGSTALKNTKSVPSASAAETNIDKKKSTVKNLKSSKQPQQKEAQISGKTSNKKGVIDTQKKDDSKEKLEKSVITEKVSAKASKRTVVIDNLKKETKTDTKVSSKNDKDVSKTSQSSQKKEDIVVDKRIRRNALIISQNDIEKLNSNSKDENKKNVKISQTKKKPDNTKKELTKSKPNTKATTNKSINKQLNKKSKK